MRCLISFAGIQRSKAVSFALAASLALTVTAPEIDQVHIDHGDELQIAQMKGKGKGNGAGLAASRKGQHGDQENAASGEEDDDESSGAGGRHCPAGQSVAPLRGRGGSASPHGAGCL